MQYEIEADIIENRSVEVLKQQINAFYIICMDGGYIMEEYVKLQMKGLREVIDYSQKLLPAVHEIIGELKMGRKKDTGEILNLIILGINWEIEMYNYCEKLINAEHRIIDKKQMTAAVNDLGFVLKSGDDARIADCLELHFIPFLSVLESAAKETLLRDIE